MNFAEIISDFKSYDSKRYYAILKKLDLEEVESAAITEPQPEYLLK